MQKERIHKSIWILLGLGLMSSLPIGVTVQTLAHSHETLAIWLLIVLSVVGVAVVLVRNKMFPKEEAGF
ncbi:MAG: hypothetical protein WCT50_00015 [Patescibacteria group bacterium]|jgi:hypothetical protein